MGKRGGKVNWEKAPDVEKRIGKLVTSLGMSWVKNANVHCFRSVNSKSRAYARIWGLSRVWQIALDEKPSYIIEVLSEKFDKLPKERKDEVLIHELAHIPKNFSGSLLPHIRKKGKRNFHDRVNRMVRRLNKTKMK
jgi:predicted metallopeptidase